MLTKKTFKVSRLFEVLHGIDLCAGVAGSFGFSYALARSKKIIMDECLEIEKLNKPDPDYEAYLKVRQDLVENELASKTAGEIDYTIQPDGYTRLPVFKNPVEAELQLATLANKYRDAIESRKQKNADYIKFVTGEEVTVDLYLVKLAHVPEDKVTPAMLYGIVELLEEPA